MACLRSGKGGLDTADTLCIEENHLRKFNEVVEAGVPVGNDNRLDTKGICFSGNPLNYSIHTAAISAAGDDPYALHCKSSHWSTWSRRMATFACFPIIFSNK